MSKDENMSKYAIPYAKRVCKGRGVDVGPGGKEHAFPGSISVNLNMYLEEEAIYLPWKDYDYIYSSYLLQEIPDINEVISHWHISLKEGGILFVYVPEVVMKEVFNNIKENNFKDIHMSGIDLNKGVMIYGRK